MDRAGNAELRIRSGTKTFRSIRLALEGGDANATAEGADLLPGRAPMYRSCKGPPRKLAETQVLFDGVAAALLSVSENQIVAIAPYAVDGKTAAQLTIIVNCVADYQQFN